MSTLHGTALHYIKHSVARVNPRWNAFSTCRDVRQSYALKRAEKTDRKFDGGRLRCGDDTLHEQKQYQTCWTQNYFPTTSSKTLRQNMHTRTESVDLNSRKWNRATENNWIGYYFAEAIYLNTTIFCFLHKLHVCFKYLVCDVCAYCLCCCRFDVAVLLHKSFCFTWICTMCNVHTVYAVYEQCCHDILFFRYQCSKPNS